MILHTFTTEEHWTTDEDGYEDQVYLSVTLAGVEVWRDMNPSWGKPDQTMERFAERLFEVLS